MLLYIYTESSMDLTDVMWLFYMPDMYCSDVDRTYSMIFWLMHNECQCRTVGDFRSGYSNVEFQSVFSILFDLISPVLTYVVCHCPCLRVCL